MGLSASGYREVLACEWDKPACEAFRANFPGVPLHEGDITKLDPAVLGLPPRELDLLDSSPPCQGVSLTGLRRQADPRNQLWREVIRLAAAWRPKVVVVENVKGLVTGVFRSEVFQPLCSALRELGYTVGAQLVDASLLGVPQHRVRVFVIAVRQGVGVPVFPVPTTRPVTVREAFAGLGDDVGPYTRPTGKGMTVAQLTEPGYDGSRALAARGGKRAHYSCKRLAWDRPSMCLVRDYRAGTGSGFLHPAEDRFLGVRELARIQSFPDQWDWLGQYYEQTHHLIGNSVAPMVARAVGMALLPILEPKTVSSSSES